MLRSLRVGVCVLAIALVMPPGSEPRPAAAAEPTTTVYLPNIVKMLGGPDGWNTPFIVQNVGSTTTDLTFEFYSFTDGALVKTRSVAGLAPGTSVFHSPNHDPDLQPWGQYSVVVKSFGSPVVAVVNEHQAEARPSRQEALSYNGLTLGSTRTYLPVVYVLHGGWYCTVIAQNLGGRSAVVSADFRAADGRTARLSRTVPAGGSKFIDPRFEPALVSDMQYSAVLQSTEPIGVVVNCHNDDAKQPFPRAFSYNGLRATNELTAFSPYAVKSVDGRVSKILVQNTGLAAARPRMHLYPLGSARPVTVEGPLLEHGAVWTHSAGAAPTPPAEFAVVVEGGQMVVMVETEGSVVNAMGYASNTEWSTRLFLPNVTRTLGGPLGWTTPIALQSQGAFAATLRWYRFSDGRLVSTQRITFGLQLRGSGFKIDPRNNPELSDDTQYAVVIDSSTGGVGAVVLELNSRGGDSAMAYEGMPLGPIAPFGTSNCTPAAGISGTSVKCRFYGLPPGATPVNYKISRAGVTPGPGTTVDEPIASDGSWSLNIGTGLMGPAQWVATITAGGASQTATFSVLPGTFGVVLTQATNGRIVAQTKPGAICIAWAFLPNETYSQAAQLYEARTADANGTVTWTYPPDAGTGSGTQVVRCVVDGETHQAGQQYSLP